MSKEVWKSEKLGAIIRELNESQDVFLKAFAEDIHTRVRRNKFIYMH
jgi:hypothetical protein